MNMGIRQKFYVLAGLSALLVAIIAIVGFVTSRSIVAGNVESELNTTVEAQRNLIDGWVKEKGSSVTHVANLISDMNGDMNLIKRRGNVAVATSDKEIIEMTFGLEDGYFVGYVNGEITGQVDPRQRPWYQLAKSKPGTSYTEPYIDTFTKQLIFSAAAPITANGTFIGATCNDIALNTLTNQVNLLKYHGEGIGFILDRSGNIIATNGRAAVMSNIRNVDGIGQNFDTMLSKGEGYVTITRDGEEQIFAYATIPSTGWIVGLTAPSDVVFAELYSLRNIYIALFIVSFLLMMALCARVAVSIVSPVAKLQRHASQMAEGNLNLEDLPVESDDEIGHMTGAFNHMLRHLRKLISQMMTSSEQLAAASEQLTASAQQSADASVQVAETVADVETSMQQQLDDVNKTKESMDVVFRDIEQMSDKAISVSEATTKTSDSAQRGSELMKDAIEKIQNIEVSVSAAATVIKKLGENSKQIGEIVEAISSISDQTNLLALNAAIEAARAGEAGKGFAVVADEVRKLAAATRESAEQIRNRIGSVLSDTDNAVHSMESGTADVKLGTEAISAVGEQFNSILQMVESMRTEMQGIMESVDTVSGGATNIVNAVDSIDTVSHKTADDTRTISESTQTQSASNEEIAAASQSLAKLATDMRVTIGAFKI